MARLKTLDLVSRAEQGATMVIRDYTLPPDAAGIVPPLRGADGTPATLLIKGIDSATAKALDFEARASRENEAASNAALLAAGTPPAERTAEDEAAAAERNIDRMVAVTAGWTGIEDDADQPDPCTPDNVRTLYTHNPQVLQDAMLFHYRRADFFAQASTPSAPSVITSLG